MLAGRNSNKGAALYLSPLPPSQHLQSDLHKSLPLMATGWQEPLSSVTRASAAGRPNYSTSAHPLTFQNETLEPSWYSARYLHMGIRRHNWKDLWNLGDLGSADGFCHWDCPVLVCFEGVEVAKGTLRVGHKTNIFGRKCLKACCW